MGAASIVGHMDSPVEPANDRNSEVGRVTGRPTLPLRDSDLDAFGGADFLSQLLAEGIGAADHHYRAPAVAHKHADRMNLRSVIVGFYNKLKRFNARDLLMGESVYRKNPNGVLTGFVSGRDDLSSGK